MNNVFNPLELPFVFLGERDQLPSCPAIYFAIDSSDRFLYIGQTQNLLARWKSKSHHRFHKLQEIDRDSPVRIAWQAWNEEENEDDLDETEREFIQRFQPLLNTTKVETPAIVPSEEILRNFLKTFARRLIIVGIEPKTTDKLLVVHLHYDWQDCSSKGTTAKIKEYINQNKDKNTSLKFKRYPVTKFNSFAGEIFRPGSRAQKTAARQHRSYNNRWELACNGVMIHISPTYDYRKYKDQSIKTTLAGVNFRVITEEVFMENKYYNEIFGLSYFTNDPVPLFWSNS